MKVPSVSVAESLLSEASKLNPGVWVHHNRVAAKCAKIIAKKCSMDVDAAYVMGLLHDIGRRYGISDLMHTYDGYKFMMENGYNDSARICLTHSFPYKNINAYNGDNDCSDDITGHIQEFINKIEYDDYDKLIQLCDAISFPEGVCVIEKRLIDVVIRKGFNGSTILKWKEFINLREYFESKINCNLYSLFDNIIL
jgi:hypothetical protein